MLGVKEYPYGISSKYEKHSGGGIARVVIELVNEISIKYPETEITLIVRKMPGQLSKEVINNLTILRVPWKNSRYLRMPVFAYFSLIKALRTGKKFDIVHAHGAFGIGISHLLKIAYPRLKVVASPHGGPLTKNSVYNNLATYLFQKLEKFNLKKAENVIFLTDAEKKQLCDAYNLIPKNNFVIPSGITEIKTEKNQNSGDPFSIVFIGRLMPRKGVDKLIRALSLLPEEIKDKVKLTVVGDGHSKDELFKLTESLGLSSIIYFAGFSKAIGSFLSHADLFILPSEGGEGLPISVMEAMSAKVAVMISNFEAPFKDDSYFRLKDNHPETIKTAIIELYHDKQKLNNLAQNGYIEFKEKYSIDVAASRYYEFYTNLISNC